MKRSELFFAFIQVPIDCVMVILSFAISYHLRSGLEVNQFSTDFGIKTYVLYGFYLLPVIIILFALNGLYKIRNYFGLFSEFYRVFIATSTAVMFLVVFIFLTKSLFFSRLILVFTWILSILLIYFGRIVLLLAQRALLRAGIGQRSVILVGEGELSAQIAAELVRNNQAYLVIGLVSTGGNHSTGIKELGTLNELDSIIKGRQIDEIILTDSTIQRQKMISLIEMCTDNKVTFKYIPDAYALMAANFAPALLGTIPVMELKPIPLDGWGRIIKRILDVLFALVFLALLSPLLALIALFIKLTSKGPILYAHERVGRDEETFKFYKFRSMYVDKSDFQGGVYWTTKADDENRVTPVGKILRKTNLDELPQLWNIFVGDMSFVGPRPEFPKHVERFERDIPDYFRRHRVKSGLTGWAAVNGLKGDTSIKERVKYDIYYIENWSLWFDFKIICKTIGLVFNEAFAGKSEYRTRS